MTSFKRISQNKRACVLTIIAISFIGSALFSLVVRHQPSINDEFCYLLQGDTFAHARLTNPPHAMRESFATIQVLMEPTYQAKYPPGQGLILAAGQILTGNPMVAVWLSLALACGAICWMLQAWVPAEWALFGALLATCRLVFLGSFKESIEGNFAYWGQSYFGGALTALGGALVLGAVRRLANRVSYPTAMILGLGLMLLMLTRPYEGAVVAAPPILFLAYHLLRKGRLFSKPLAMLLAAIPVALGSAFMLAYNKAVTGNALVLPYFIYENRFCPRPIFLFQHLRDAPGANDPAVAIYNAKFEMAEVWLPQRTLAGYAFSVFWKAWIAWDFYFGEWLGIPFIWGLFGRRINVWNKVSNATLAIMFACTFTLEAFVSSHYIAAATGLLYYATVQGCRRMNLVMFPSRKRIVLPFLVLCFAGTLLVSMTEKKYFEDSFSQVRFRIQKEMEARAGNHLVLVHYGPEHGHFHEWVYNGATIDGAKVLWARSLDEAQNNKLMDYFSNYHVWLLEENSPAFQPCKPTLKQLR